MMSPRKMIAFGWLMQIAAYLALWQLTSVWIAVAVLFMICGNNLREAGSLSAILSEFGEGVAGTRRPM